MVDQPPPNPGHPTEPGPGYSYPPGPGSPQQPGRDDPHQWGPSGQPGHPYPGAGPVQPGPYPGAYPTQPGYPHPGAYPVQPGYPYPGAAPAQPGPYPGAYPIQPGYPYPAADPTQPGYPGPYGLVFAGYPDPNDPLVTPPGAGVGGWFERVGSTLRRSWRLLLVILVITQAVPGLLLSLVTLPFQPKPLTTSDQAAADPAALTGYLGHLLAFLGAALVVGIVVSLVTSVGWGAGTWVLVRQANGEPASLADALRYGLRRAPGLWAWYLLSSLIILAGFVACFLPALYCAVAVSLVGPSYLFERHSPVARSFRMLHARFGMVLGRIALLAALLVAGGLVISVIQGVGLLGSTGGAGTPPSLSPGFVLTTIVGAVLSLPLYAGLLVGLVITYAEQRGQEAPVNVRQLAGELG